MSLTAKTVSELAAHVGGRLFGDGDISINRVASLDSASEGDIAYVEEEKLFAAAAKSKASCVIAPSGTTVEVPCRIEASNPKLSFTLIAELLRPAKQRRPEIHNTAVISPAAKIGSDVFIGAFVCLGENSTVGDRTQIRAGAKIGDNVTVGSDCVIHPNVFLEDGVTIGNKVILHAGVVVGADGFASVRGEMVYDEFPTIV